VHIFCRQSGSIYLICDRNVLSHIISSKQSTAASSTGPLLLLSTSSVVSLINFVLFYTNASLHKQRSNKGVFLMPKYFKHLKFCFSQNVRECFSATLNNHLDIFWPRLSSSIDYICQASGWDRRNQDMTTIVSDSTLSCLNLLQPSGNYMYHLLKH
jgi:hypothetical protein